MSVMKIQACARVRMRCVKTPQEATSVLARRVLCARMMCVSLRRKKVSFLIFVARLACLIVYKLPFFFVPHFVVRLIEIDHSTLLEISISLHFPSYFFLS